MTNADVDVEDAVEDDVVVAVGAVVGNVVARALALLGWALLAVLAQALKRARRGSWAEETDDGQGNQNSADQSHCCYCCSG